MSAHVYNENLDSQYPATLSKKIITDLLREKLGFEGVVITDDLQMKAIRDLYNLKESIRLAVLSGADLLLFANNEIYDENIAYKVISYIKEMIEAEEISLERIEESFQRIQLLKSKPFENHLFSQKKQISEEVY
jgi:beta-N-acetylhexosaminidase